MYTCIFFEKSRTENAILLIRDEEGFEFSTSKCWSWKIYISVWKKGLINRRGKDWIGEKNNRRGRICLGISIRLGEKFVGKNRTNVWGFSTERQTSCWERQMSREVGDRSTRKRSRRGRKRKRKPRSKQSGHYSRPTADGAAYKISRITNSCLSFSLFLYETGQSRILANCFNYF